MKIKKLSPTATVPTRATVGSAGWDLVADKDVLIYDYCTELVGTGVSIEIPTNHVGLVCSRSGLAKRGLVVANAPGIIDSDYRGELCVLLYSRGGARVVRAGDRIAQLVVVPCLMVDSVLVDELTESGRGAGGFGSTGV